MLRRRRKPTFFTVLLFAVILMTALSLATVFHLIPPLETRLPEFSAEEYIQLCGDAHPAWFPRKSGNGLSFVEISLSNWGPKTGPFLGVVIRDRTNRKMLEEELRPNRPGLRVLYISGYGRTEVNKRRAIPLDAPFLQKPFTPDELVTAARCARETVIGTPGYGDSHTWSMNGS